MKKKMDPMFRAAIAEAEVQQPLYGPGNLLKTCEDDPWDRSCVYQAESWEVNTDFTVWTFKVRDDILWHDGQPFSAEDIKFWADLSVNGAPEAGRSKSREASNFGNPSSIDVLPNNVIRITLKSPVINFPVILGDPAMMIAHPKHLTEPELAKGEDVAPPDIDYVGTGPFKFELYDKGSVIEVTRFDRYFEKDEFGRQLPYLDGIQFPIIKDREAMVAAFRTGRIDTTGRGNRVWFLPEQIEATKKQMGDEAVFVPVPSGYPGVIFNLNREGPWQDVRVRKAMFLAPDWTAGAKALYGPESKPVALFFSGSPWQNPDFMTWPGFNPATKEQDRAEAKRLMAEAGYADGFEVTLACRAGAWEADCEWFIEQLRQHLKIQVALDIVDSATRGDRQCNLTYDAITPGGTPKWPEEMSSLAGGYKNAPCTTKFFHDDPKVKGFLDRIAAASTLEERIAASRELEKYVAFEKVYGYTFFESPYTFARRSYVKGIQNPVSNPNGMLDAARWWMDK